MAGPLVLGFDPDTANTAWAVVDKDRIYGVGIIRALGPILMMRHVSVAVPGILKKWKIDMAVVEGQQIYTKGKAAKAAHADILKLTQTAGGILGVISSLDPTLRLTSPLPSEWKGQAPKPVDQARSYTHYGLEFSKNSHFAWPIGCQKALQIDGFASSRKSEWEHIGDAIGLARYGTRLLDSTAPKQVM